MLHLFIERTGLIVLMILHQPSDEILKAMHSIIVMIKGQIVFQQEDMKTFNPEAGQAQFVHQMLRDGSSTGTSSSDSSPNATIKEDENTSSQMLRDGSSTGTSSSDLSPNATIKEDENMSSQMLCDGSSTDTSSSDSSPNATIREDENMRSKSHSIPRSSSIVQLVFEGSSRFTCLSDTIEQQEVGGSNTIRVPVSQYLDRVHYDALRRRQPSAESSPRATRLRATISSRSEDVVSNAIYFIKQLPKAIAKDFTSLWQVQPLLRRMQLHVGTPWLDFGVVLVVAVIAGWSQYNTQRFGVSGEFAE